MTSLKAHTKGSPFPPPKSSLWRVYSSRFCPYAERTLLVLEHKNIPYEVVNIHLRNKPEWLVEKNPSGTVPVAEKDGLVVYESTATCEWIDDLHPSPRLAPSDPLVKAQDRMYLEYMGKMAKILYELIFPKQDDAEKLISDLQIHYKYYNAALASRDGPFFGGSSPSLLDFYLWPHTYRFDAFTHLHPRAAIDQAEFPALSRWFQAMDRLPAVRKLRHSRDTFARFVATHHVGKPDYDLGLELNDS